MKIDFPVSIGLIGAPSSGKEDLADAFVGISADWFAENKAEFQVIPNSGRLIEEKGQAMGVFGDGTDDLRAFFLRFEAEQKAWADGISTLSLGTAVENIAHCGVNLENIMTGVTLPNQQERMQKQQVIMTALTFLFLERFRYLFGFYVPTPTTAIILPDGEDADATYSRRVDSAIRTIFNNFGMRLQVLDQPTVEEKAQEMFDTVKNIVENGPPELPIEETEQPGESDVDVDVPPVAEITLAE